MTGYDYTPFIERAPSDTRLRLERYRDALPAGSQLTYIAIGRLFDPIRLGALEMRGISSTKQLGDVLVALKNISVVATQTPYEEAIAAYNFCSLYKVPLVVQVHNDPLFKAPGLRGRLISWLRRVMLNYAVKKAALVRCVNPDTVAVLQKIFPGKRVEFAPVPITMSPLPPAPATPPEVLYVGRLAPEKNLPLWLHVASEVHQKRPDVHFHIVGPGEAFPAQDHITFHGGKPNDQLGPYYQRASVFLLTSREEGFGRVLVEAMAHGVPIVSTPTRGAKAIIGDNEAGTIAEAPQLAKAVLDYLNDPEKHKKASLAGLQLASQYTPEEAISRWIGLIIDIAEQSAKEKTL
jgi:glycosyltransferase involved in cell wall biosynthesis